MIHRIVIQNLYYQDYALYGNKSHSNHIFRIQMIFTKIFPILSLLFNNLVCQ